MLSNKTFIIIAIVLIVLMIIQYNTNQELVEKMSNDKQKSDKICSQKSINDAYSYWIFGSPKFVR